MPGGEVVIEAPPEVPRTVPGNIMLKLLPVVMVAAMVGMVALMFTSGAAANPMALLFPVMMVVSMLGMFAGGGARGTGARNAEADESRKDYLAYLDRLRGEVTDTARAQRTALEWSHPQTDSLWTLVGTGRMWERRSSDGDFGHVRVGVGSQRLATRLVSPETGPVDGLEPVSAVSLRSFVRVHSIVPELPTAVSLRGFAAVGVEGDRVAARALIRSMLMQLCTFHGPDDLAVVVIRGQDVAAEWDWIKWLPHCRHSHAVDGAGAARMVYSSFGEADRGLGHLLAGRGNFVRHAASAGMQHLIVVVDGALTDAHTVSWAVHGADATTILDVSDRASELVVAQGLQLVVDGTTLGARSSVGVEEFGTVDRVSVGEARRFGRTIAQFDTGAEDESGGSSDDGHESWVRLVGWSDRAAGSSAGEPWTVRRGRDRLRVPIGVEPDGRVVDIDLKESAEGGMGPHGLCIGATGSGKSEFLRTLVLGLIATHSPDVLNLVLVDFKGGASFLGLEHAPHVAAVITNLADESAMVERMRDALAGEMNRRQELLRASGNFANVTDYHRARDGGADLGPLPALFVVVDEFSEMLTQFPDFAELFVAIGRLGRSLHMHLLLASQRLDEGRLRGLDSHLSYRIGLKTFSANESRSVLGVPDAYHLPPQPGSGYLKTDATDIVRFSAAYVSGPYRPEIGPDPGRAGSRGIDRTVRVFTSTPVPLPPPHEPEVPLPSPLPPPHAPGAEGGPTVLEAVVSRVRGRGTPAHPVWLPPLSDPPTLDRLLAEAGAVVPGSLRAPIGVIDRPYDQRRDPLTMDLTGSRGNVAVVGGPQSGKSTVLRSMILSFAATHSAEQVQFYCLDFGGGALSSVTDLPHVGSVATRLDGDRVRRTVAELTALVRRRERLFQQWDVESMADFRARRSPGANGTGPSSDTHGDAFLVVDGWSTVRSEHEQLEPQITQLAAQGLSFGVHVVITAARWADIRPALKDSLGTRIELRLGDPTDSEIGRARAATVPEGRPGRGMTKDGLHLLTAVPRLDSVNSADNLGGAVSAAVAVITAGHRTASAPPVRLLPERYPRDRMLADVAGVWPPPASAPPASRRHVPIGIDETELAPVFVDFEDSPHLLVFGDSRCGKTTLLRSICDSIVAAHAPTEAKIVLGDYRRTMLGAVPDEHLGGYASTATLLATMVGELADVMRGRRPGPDTTHEQLRARSWWTGPEVYLIVDDYDLVASPAGNPLSELLELLPQARDVGLHLVLARRSGGSARALYEPVVARLRDLATAGLIMSGSKDEGVLLGTVKPSEQPPGRGTIVSRNRTGLVQTAWMPPL